MCSEFHSASFSNMQKIGMKLGVYAYPYRIIPPSLSNSEFHTCLKLGYTPQIANLPSGKLT